jgi:peptide/nickel transport system permease protein
VDNGSISSAIALRLPRTLEIIIVGAILALMLAIPAGTAAGHRRSLQWFETYL